MKIIRESLWESLRNKFRLRLFQKVEPHFDELKWRVQSDLDRIKQNEAIQDCARRWRKFRENLLPRQVINLIRRPPVGGCSHKKGIGPYEGPDIEFRRAVLTDFNVSTHVYIDGSQRIRCHRCGEVWRPGDTGYGDAVRMTENSTNFCSTSEGLYYVDQDGRRIDTSKLTPAQMTELLTRARPPKPTNEHVVTFFDKLECGRIDNECRPYEENTNAINQ